MSKPDINFLSLADVEGQTLIGVPIYPEDWNPVQYADMLKLSNAKDCAIEACVIGGGYEDCIDMNRNCSGILIRRCDLNPTGKYAITIKGGCEDIFIKDCVIFGSGKEFDIDLGNWSDQSKAKTKRVFLINVTRADGKPVRVRVLNSERPQIEGGNIELTVIPPILVKIWFFFRGLL